MILFGPEFEPDEAEESLLQVSVTTVYPAGRALTSDWFINRLVVSEIVKSSDFSVYQKLELNKNAFQ